MCTKVLKGTGVDPPVALLLELPLPPEAAVREFGALAFCDAADAPTDADNTPALPPPIEAEESAEVELTPEVELVVVLLARFNTPGELELSDEPLLLEAGVRRALPEAAVPPAPAPEDEPAVLEATAVGVPPREAWMYRSCRLPGLRWNLGSASRITWYWLTWV
jgi:hypothetical protein